MNIFNLFKRPKAIKPLPTYPHIDLKDVPAASCLLFYGSPGNKATETVGERLYGHKYHPPAFHAALYLGDNEILNVGRFKEIKNVYQQYTNTRRVDVIVYKLHSFDRDVVVSNGRRDISKNKHKVTDYAITDFLRFGLKWWKPSKKDFCSENVVENLNTIGFHPTDTEPYNTAPWDLLEWAEAHPDLATIYTLHEGDIFKQKVGR